MTEEQMIELYKFIEGPEGCNFREESGMKVWNCDGTLTKTKIWLEKNNLTKDAINWGGHCDCEVIINFPFEFEEEEQEQ